MELVLSYWKLKRQSRNGHPLVRRLQTSLHAQKNAQPVCSSVSHAQEASHSLFDIDLGLAESKCWGVFCSMEDAKGGKTQRFLLHRRSRFFSSGPKRGREQGAEGAAEGVAPPPTRPGASPAAAGADPQTGEAEEGGGTAGAGATRAAPPHNRRLTLSPLSSQIKQHETLLEMQLTPFSILLRALLDQLQMKDQARIFAQPVDVSEVKTSTERRKRVVSIFLKGSTEIITTGTTIVRPKLFLPL